MRLARLHESELKIPKGFDSDISGYSYSIIDFVNLDEFQAVITSCSPYGEATFFSLVVFVKEEGIGGRMVSQWTSARFLQSEQIGNLKHLFSAINDFHTRNKFDNWVDNYLKVPVRPIW